MITDYSPCRCGDILQLLWVGHFQKEPSEIGLVMKRSRHGKTGLVTCVVFGMAQQLFLQSEETTAGRMRTHVLLLQQVLVLYVVLWSANTQVSMTLVGC